MPLKVPFQLYIIHLVLMLSPALLISMLYFVAQSGETPPTPSEETRVFQFTAAILTIIAVGFSQLVPRFMVKGDALPMQRYISMKIVQWALVEGAAVFIAVIYFLTREPNMLIPLGILIALIGFMRPTDDELIRYNVKK